MPKWLCKCDYLHDDEKEQTKFEDFPDDWVCPKCSLIKKRFMRIVETKDDSHVKVLQAQYDREKEWKMDLKGYFTIKPFPEEGLIKIRCYNIKNELLLVIEGKTAMDIYNTIVREELISSLQHAADIGAELQKAEIAMQLGIPYEQDSPLELSTCKNNNT